MKKRGQHEVFSASYIFNNHVAACEKYVQLFNLQRLPDSIISVAYHRRFVSSNTNFFSPLQPQLISQPIILLLPLQPTGKRLYEEVWAVAHSLLKKDSQYHDRESHWWNQKEWKQILDGSKDSKSSCLPFVLKFVDRQGYNCSQCDWTKRCSGCVIEPSETVLIYDWLTKCHLAIEWHSQTIETEFDLSVNEIIRHSSVDTISDKIDEKAISLEKCLALFHEADQLPKQSMCEDCGRER